MQKDFHYDVVYVLAQWAGYSAHDAYILAYSSQFVDDAAEEGTIGFDDGSYYSIISSSHAPYDFIHNTNEISNKLAWLPFHFLPGNCGLPKGEGLDLDIVDRLICQPNSYVAQDMVCQCLNLDNGARTLQRLGITIHVYADTWAHQGFCGIVRNQNKVKWLHRVENPWTPFGFIHYLQNVRLRFINLLPLGHAAASVYPDLPYLKKWAIIYTDKRGAVRRNNTADFVEAAGKIYQILRAFKQQKRGESLAAILRDVPPLEPEKSRLLATLFRRFRYKNENVRHRRWLRKIRANVIPGVRDIPDYDVTGRDSWRFLALGDEKAMKNGKYHRQQSFNRSNWKLFYDALKAHQRFVLGTLLPSYSIDIWPYL